VARRNIVVPEADGRPESTDACARIHAEALPEPTTVLMDLRRRGGYDRFQPMVQEDPRPLSISLRNFRSPAAIWLGGPGNLLGGVPAMASRGRDNSALEVELALRGSVLPLGIPAILTEENWKV
jgi:hypothetical protein